MKAYYDNKPVATEAVGNGNWLYRWEIKQEEFTDETGNRSRWTCEEVTVNGEPEYGKCIVAVIRSRYSADDELALVNKYNSYKQGIIEDASIETEYAEYLKFVKGVKEQVRNDLSLNTVGDGEGNILESVMSKSVKEPPKGTYLNPIAYGKGDSLSKGKYYTQYGVVYECVKGTSGVKKDLYQMTTYAKPFDD